jgi:hypothetical protein
MNIKKLRYENIRPDGSSDTESGIVCVRGNISTGVDHKGRWLTAALPRTDDGVVEGVIVEFADDAEFEKFLSEETVFKEGTPQ